MTIVESLRPCECSVSASIVMKAVNEARSLGGAPSKSIWMPL